MTLLTDLQNYHPFNEQEAADVKEMIYRLETGEELFLRSNLAESLYGFSLGSQSGPGQSLDGLPPDLRLLGLAGWTRGRRPGPFARGLEGSRGRKRS